jgi:hypothetical protein
MVVCALYSNYLIASQVDGHRFGRIIGPDGCADILRRRVGQIETGVGDYCATPRLIIEFEPVVSSIAARLLKPY